MLQGKMLALSIIELDNEIEDTSIYIHVPFQKQDIMIFFHNRRERTEHPPPPHFFQLLKK